MWEKNKLRFKDLFHSVNLQNFIGIKSIEAFKPSAHLPSGGGAANVANCWRTDSCVHFHVQCALSWREKVWVLNISCTMYRGGYCLLENIVCRWILFPIFWQTLTHFSLLSTWEYIGHFPSSYFTFCPHKSLSPTFFPGKPFKMHSCYRTLTYPKNSTQVLKSCCEKKKNHAKKLLSHIFC